MLQDNLANLTECIRWTWHLTVQFIPFTSLAKASRTTQLWFTLLKYYKSFTSTLHINTHTYKHTNIHTCIYIYIHIYVCVFVCVCVFACMCVYVCVYTWLFHNIKKYQSGKTNNMWIFLFVISEHLQLKKNDLYFGKISLKFHTIRFLRKNYLNQLLLSLWKL